MRPKSMFEITLREYAPYFTTFLWAKLKKSSVKCRLFKKLLCLHLQVKACFMHGTNIPYYNTQEHLFEITYSKHYRFVTLTVLLNV